MPSFQVLEGGTPSFSEQIGQQLGGGLSEGLQEHFERKKRMKTQSRINEIINGGQIRTPSASQTLQQTLGGPGGMEAQGGLGQQLGGSQGAQAPKSPWLSNQQLNAIKAEDPTIGAEIEKQQTERQKAYNESYKPHQEFINNQLKEATGIKTTEARLLKMKQLNDNGELMGPKLATTAKALHLPVAFFGGPKDEEFEKLSIDLTKDIQQYYGNRILATEFAAFMRSIPTLTNSKEGRDRVIENMLLLQEPKKMQYEIAKKLRNQYAQAGEPLPPDFQAIVAEQMEPEMDKFAEKFRNNWEEAEQLKSGKKLPQKTAQGSKPKERESLQDIFG